MGQLVDPSKLVIVRATHESGGVTLHEADDCPRTGDCPVYRSFHPLPLTWEQAKEEIDRIRELNPATYTAMRHEATNELVAELRDWLGEDHGQDIGTSDVSIKVINMYRFGEMEV